MFSITLLPGDGIGPEVTSAAVKVLKTVAEKFNIEFNFKTELIGGASYDKYSTPLTDEVLSQCYSSDVVFLGAVGGPKWENLPHHLKPEAALLKLRKALGLYANLRPAKIYNSMLSYSSLKEEVLKGTDVLIVRELTGDAYFGEPRGYDEQKGFNTMIYTKEEVERIARKAFELARFRNKKVTSVDKANVLEVSQFWRKVVIDVHKDYQDVELNHMYVDNAAMQIVRYPKQFDVILTSNLFGDILSDIAAMITGSLGMLPSASLGSKYALYEPVHGSAPDIAGKGIANPIAAISSVAMMLKYSFQMDKAAELIENSIENTLTKGYRTKDIYKEGDKLVSTDEMTDKIIEEFDKLFAKEAINVFTL
ncbi:MAG: 3-isopropylmalate dehydrogenase [Melioribacter sp.]|nr:3-isopropylmalate dehydrogenase [Melioribacter sp.]